LSHHDARNPGWLPPGILAEHYHVQRELGRGGMSMVYLCTDARTGENVAVKILRQELGSAVTIERFLREIDFASELDHPRIPKVLDSGVVEALPFYAMTYIEGESLGARIKREKQLPIGDAVRIACGVLEAMTYAHSRGIVHRDIKPENILLSGDAVYVLDFGVARAIIESGGDRLTSTGIAVGTLAYMSPEQASGDRDLDARSDVYSLGSVLYEMLAGIPPFVGPTAQVVMSRRFMAPPAPLREIRESVPAIIEQVVAKALEKSLPDRWASAAEFSSALRVPVAAATTSRVGRRTQRRRRIAGRMIGGVLLLAAGGGGAYAWSATHRNHILSAQDQIRQWNLDEAGAELRLAIEKGSDDPVAQLWLAQVEMLRGQPADDWKPYLLAANDRRAELDSTDQMRLDALTAINVGNHGDACPRFAKLIEMSSDGKYRDFTPTLGLADCVLGDRAVIPDSASPSGFRFRSSHNFADSLYGGLLERNRERPSAYTAIMPRLEKLLRVDSRRIRTGKRPDGKGPTNFARPSIAADTLVFKPYVPTGSKTDRRFDAPDRVERRFSATSNGGARSRRGGRAPLLQIPKRTKRSRFSSNDRGSSTGGVNRHSER